MKNMALLFVGFVVLTAWCIPCFAQEEYKHKSADEIAKMSPAEKVEEMAKERFYHSEPDNDDPEQPALIRDQILIDGVKVLPALAEFADQYLPNPEPDKYRYEIVRMQTALWTAFDIDNTEHRIRTTNEGREVIKAFERVLERLKKLDAAGTPYGEMYHDVTLQEFWSIYVTALLQLLDGTELGPIDMRIGTTLEEKHNIELSTEELTKFVEFLITRAPAYPSWCNTERQRPNSSDACSKSKKYYNVYLEFKAKATANN